MKYPTLEQVLQSDSTEGCDKVGLVTRLRGETSEGILDCKKALEEASWDYDEARRLLMQKVRDRRVGAIWLGNDPHATDADDEQDANDEIPERVFKTTEQMDKVKRLMEESGDAEATCKLALCYFDQNYEEALKALKSCSWHRPPPEPSESRSSGGASWKFAGCVRHK